MALPVSATALYRDLQVIFGPRLLSFVIYRPATPVSEGTVHTLATVETLTAADLRACAARSSAWDSQRLATPLLLAKEEFVRALDSFPLEFGAILADYEVVGGEDPFLGVSVNENDLRRACEAQVRSHLLHLREGFIESQGRGHAVAELIADSAAPLAGLLGSVSRLLGHPTTSPDDAASTVERAAHLAPGSLGDVLRHAGDGDPTRQLFEPYLAAVEQLVHFIDRWGA